VVNAPGKPCRRFHAQQAKRKAWACSLETATGRKILTAQVRPVALQETGEPNAKRSTVLLDFYLQKATLTQ
jgi:hypothetical protein